MSDGCLFEVPCTVLGAGGFIGSHLCQALVAAGAQVRGFGRRPLFPDSMPRINFTYGEFNDRTALARAIDGAEVVFHLLGGTTPEVSNNDPAADLQSSTLASIHLFELCRNSGVRKLVFASSGGTVYGVPSVVPITEDAQTDPISAYGINKLAVEKFAQLYDHLGGAKAVSLRIANPFGPFQSPSRRQGLIPAATMALLADVPFEVWGDGSVIRDYVYVTDVVEALVSAAAYDGRFKIFNIGSGVGRSIVDVVNSLGEILGRTPKLRFKASRRADVPKNILDIQRANDALAWSPRTHWVDGLRKSLEWVQTFEVTHR